MISAWLALPGLLCPPRDFGHVAALLARDGLELWALDQWRVPLSAAPGQILAATAVALGRQPGEQLGTIGLVGHSMGAATALNLSLALAPGGPLAGVATVGALVLLDPMTPAGPTPWWADAGARLLTHPRPGGAPVPVSPAYLDVQESPRGRRRLQAPTSDAAPHPSGHPKHHSNQFPSSQPNHHPNQLPSGHPNHHPNQTSSGHPNHYPSLLYSPTWSDPAPPDAYEPATVMDAIAIPDSWGTPTRASRAAELCRRLASHEGRARMAAEFARSWPLARDVTDAVGHRGSPLAPTVLQLTGMRSGPRFLREQRRYATLVGAQLTGLRCSGHLIPIERAGQVAHMLLACDG